MIKVSVVVPVYNQEKYLERCLDSILGQTLTEIEIILVDDGSTDATPEILSRYQQKDERITILRQQNQYAGVARNNGLKSAQGEYVIFWDSDDYFPEDALEVLYDEITRCDADICVGEAIKMDMSDGTVKENGCINWSRVPEKRPFSKEDIPQFIFNFAIIVPWNKLYKRSFLIDNDLKFSRLRNAEDMYFVMTAFVAAEKITVVDKIVAYYQFRNEGSLSNNFFKDRDTLLNVFLEVKDFLIESGDWENDDIRRSFINKVFVPLVPRILRLDSYEQCKVLYDFDKEEILPAFEIDEFWVEQMYSERNAFELSCMLSCDVNEFLFRQYIYCQKRASYQRDRFLQVKDKLQKAKDKNQKQDEKIANLRKDKENNIQKIQKQREKIEAQNDKIQKKNEKIEKQTDRIQRQSEKIQKQSDRIQRQREKIEKQSEEIQSQKALLDKKLVRAALKIQNLFT